MEHVVGVVTLLHFLGVIVNAEQRVFLLAGASKGCWLVKLGTKTPYFKGQPANPG